MSDEIIIDAESTDQRDHRASAFRPSGKIYLLVGIQRDLLEDEWIGQPECQRHDTGSPDNAVEVEACEEVALLAGNLVIGFVSRCSSTGRRCMFYNGRLNVRSCLPSRMTSFKGFGR